MLHDPGFIKKNNSRRHADRRQARRGGNFGLNWQMMRSAVDQLGNVGRTLTSLFQRHQKLSDCGYLYRLDQMMIKAGLPG